MHIQIQPIDYSIILIYVAFVIGIGFALKRYIKTSADFFLSGRSIPAWVAGLAFLSANLGALELVGMAASGAKYGLATCHFYWVGAIPAMVFLAVFMMPFYYGSKARSVPEYLKMRFDERTRCLNSISFAVMTVFASGISMNALAKLLHQLLGWNYDLSLWICSGVVLIYVLKGGLTSAIYTEVLQFFMIVLGFAPVVWLGLKDMGGWVTLKEVLRNVAQDPAKVGLAHDTALASNAMTSAWQPIFSGSSANLMGVDWFAIIFGLGFVLSFGYWCTNFLVIQRAMSAKDMGAARRTPLIAAVPKMLFPILVILPGMIAIGLSYIGKDNYRLPPVAISESAYPAAVETFQKFAAGRMNATATTAALQTIIKPKLSEAKIAALLAADSQQKLDSSAIRNGLQDAVADNDYDGVILSLVKKYCPSGLLGLALTALLASFMSGMAGNVTAFNTVWTYDLYQAYLAKNKNDAHYMWMGRVVTVVGILLSIACAYVASNYSNAMDIVQLVFGFVNAPLFATFLLGMFWARTTSHGAFFGLLGGTLSSALFHGLTLPAGSTAGIKGGWLATLTVFPSEMAQNFWLAACSFSACLTLTLTITLLTKRDKSDNELTGLVYSLTPKVKEHDLHWLARPAVLGTLLLLACLILNIIFW
ncbi:MAG: sodium:solute symporter family protein [Verrucomicrobiales bacterium]|jgi:SSS family solute:Na+ symporter|nr:sodium:solute symporter family protein [Verrucomicrobiales bacterium]